MLEGYVIDGRTHDLGSSKCGKCGRIWTVSTGESGQPLPQPGAFSICSFCATICQYDDNMQGQPVTAKELRQLPRWFRRKLQDLRAAVLLVDERIRMGTN